LPTPAWPTGGANTPARASRPSRPTRPVGDDDQPQQVVVRPGDSLWSIAAAGLPARAPASAVARSWPRWYGANRAVVGADPDLLHPGQVLTVPDRPDH
jgi:nucleoid-associated protein YgaU